jgi:hypothetical protein
MGPIDVEIEPVRRHVRLQEGEIEPVRRHVRLQEGEMVCRGDIRVLLHRARAFLEGLGRVSNQESWFQTYSEKIQPRIKEKALANSFMLAKGCLVNMMGEASAQEMYLYALTEYACTQAEHHMSKRELRSFPLAEIQRRLNEVIAEIDHWRPHLHARQTLFSEVVVPQQTLDLLYRPRSLQKLEQVLQTIDCQKDRMLRRNPCQFHSEEYRSLWIYLNNVTQENAYRHSLGKEGLSLQEITNLFTDVQYRYTPQKSVKAMMDLAVLRAQGQGILYAPKQTSIEDIRTCIGDLRSAYHAVCDEIAFNLRY